MSTDEVRDRYAAAARRVLDGETPGAHYRRPIPLPDASVDVVISDCVIALSTNQATVFAEIARVLRPGGRLGITDLIADDTLTDADRDAHSDIECVATALTAEEYRSSLRAAGLSGVGVQPTGEVGHKLISAIIRAVKPAPVHIAPMTATHANAVLDIFQTGIDSGGAGFEAAPPDWPTWDATHLPDHRFVALDVSGQVLGWVAATPTSGRCVYAGVVEHSVYVAPAARGRGVGSALLDTLIVSTGQAGI